MNIKHAALMISCLLLTMAAYAEDAVPSAGTTQLPNGYILVPVQNGVIPSEYLGIIQSQQPAGTTQCAQGDENCESSVQNANSQIKKEESDLDSFKRKKTVRQSRTRNSIPNTSSSATTPQNNASQQNQYRQPTDVSIKHSTGNGGNPANNYSNSGQARNYSSGGQQAKHHSGGDEQVKRHHPSEGQQARHHHSGGGQARGHSSYNQNTENH